MIKCTFNCLTNRGQKNTNMYMSQGRKEITIEVWIRDYI